CFAAILVPDIVFGMSVAFEPSAPSPAALGTVITWTATANDAGDGTLWYRFRAQSMGRDFQMLKDFGPDNTIEWTEIACEGVYQPEAPVENRDPGEVARATASLELSPLAQNGQPAITTTAHPLVFLFSAPACQTGSRMKVQFSGPDDTPHDTPYQP